MILDNFVGEFKKDYISTIGTKFPFVKVFHSTISCYHLKVSFGTNKFCRVWTTTWRWSGWPSLVSSSSPTTTFWRFCRSASPIVEGWWLRIFLETQCLVSYFKIPIGSMYGRLHLKKLRKKPFAYTLVHSFFDKPTNLNPNLRVGFFTWHNQTAILEAR